MTREDMINYFDKVVSNSIDLYDEEDEDPEEIINEEQQKVTNNKTRKELQMEFDENRKIKRKHI